MSTRDDEDPLSVKNDNLFDYLNLRPVLLPYTYLVSWISFKCPGSYIRSLGDRASFR